MDPKYSDTRIVVQKNIPCKDCEGIGSINSKDYFDGAYEYDCPKCKGSGSKVVNRRITIEQLALMIREVNNDRSKEKTISDD